MKKLLIMERSKTCPDLRWYMWDEYCDNCGTKIHGQEMKSTEKPQMNENDYCCDCLRKMIHRKSQIS